MISTTAAYNLSRNSLSAQRFSHDSGKALSRAALLMHRTRNFAGSGNPLYGSVLYLKTEEVD